jgi:catechol 2,3-dioxygenase-like lactoylglutathione lyase family enzyme
MKTFGITAALPAQDLGRAKAFYVEKVGLQALESHFLEARDGQVGLTVGDGVSQLFVYPARVRPSAEFTQAVLHVTDVRAAVEEMRGRGVEFKEYDTPETRTENGIARMPGGGEAAWFKDSGRQPGRRCSGLRRYSQEASWPFFDAAGSRGRTC